MKEINNTKILVLGASVLQKPMIDYLKSQGYIVGIVDSNKEAISANDGDAFYPVSTTDKQAVLEIAEIFKPDLLITIATDMPMRTIAYVSEKLGLPSISYDTALKSTDKQMMIETFKSHDVSHPEFKIVDLDSDFNAISNKLGLPFIVKPIDGSGSRGVQLVKNKAEFYDSINYSLQNSKVEQVLAEEYLEGIEVSVELLCKNGIVNVITITQKITSGAPHYVELGHSQPANISESNWESVSDLAISGCEVLGIKNGAAHAEVMITDKGPYIIEIGARLGGDFITSHLVPLSTGINMIGELINIMLNKNTDFTKTISCGSCIRYFILPPGRLKSIKNLEEARKMKGVEKIELDISIGDEIFPIENSSKRVGFVLTSAHTQKEALTIASNVTAMVDFEVINE